MSFDVQVIERKRDENGERYRWRAGPYPDRARAGEMAARLRKLHAPRRPRIYVAPSRRAATLDAPERVSAVEHAQRTRAGMESARSRGTHVGRPTRAVDVARARSLLREGLSMRAVAKRLRVPRRTLARALAGGAKGVVSKPGRRR
jgi:hypothetical protein